MGEDGLVSTPPIEPAVQPGRVLAVFAHPDDETLSAGGLLALLARTAEVHLVTSNRGERGEVIPTDIAHLEGRPDELAELRVAELSTALTALGVTGHYFLDQLDGHTGPARYTDSGMRWDGRSRVRALPDPGADRTAFSKADPERAAQVLAAHIRRLRPALVVTDEPDGGYGHPDHVHAALVTARAVRLAADPERAVDGDPWSVRALAWIVRPASEVWAATTWLQQTPARPRLSMMGRALQVIDADGEQPTIVVPDEQVDATVDTSAVAEQLLAAVRAHRSQVQEATFAEEAVPAARAVPTPSAAPVVPTAPAQAADAPARPGSAIGWFALSNDILQPLYGRAWLRADPGWGTPAVLRTTLTDLTSSDFAVDDRGRWTEPIPNASGLEEVPRWYLMAMSVFTVVMGVIFAFAGTAFHRWTPPWGLIMALVAVAAGGVLARTFADRRGALGYALAVTVTVFMTTWWRPGGDVLVTAQPIGYIWLVGALVAGVVGMAAPKGWFRDEP